MILVNNAKRIHLLPVFRTFHSLSYWTIHKFIPILLILLQMLVKLLFIILQTRTESLKPFIVSGVSWSLKLVLSTETQKSHFSVRPWSLLTILNFSEQEPIDTAVF